MQNVLEIGCPKGRRTQFDEPYAEQHLRLMIVAILKILFVTNILLLVNQVC